MACTSRISSCRVRRDGARHFSWEEKAMSSSTVYSKLCAVWHRLSRPDRRLNDFVGARKSLKACLVTFLLAWYILGSVAQAGVVICQNPSRSGGDWTIALGASLAQARSNATSIMGTSSWSKSVECNGGWYAFVGGDTPGMACGFQSRAAAISAAKSQCRGGCGDLCISGFDDKAHATAREGSVWMGNSYTQRSCR